MDPTRPVKPENQIFEDVAATPAAPYVHSARTRATAITKMAVQNYLEQYFNHTGCYRHQVADIAPYMVQYETGITGNRRSDDDSLYELQIARMSSRLKQKLPCIIIVDQGFRQNSTGLGGVVEGYELGTYQGLGMRIDVTVTLTLEVAANDETTASDLRDVLALIFGTLTYYNKAHVITPNDPSTSWEVRLPVRYEAQGLERRQINGDALDVFWMSNLTLDVDFEGIAVLGKESSNNIQRDNMAQEIHLNPENPFFGFEDFDMPTAINIPTEVYLGRPTSIHAQFVPFQSRFVSDDPNVLVVSGDTIVPKLRGSCNVLMLDHFGKVLGTYPVSVIL